jgi:hypothetical protein
MYGSIEHDNAPSAHRYKSCINLLETITNTTLVECPCVATAYQVFSSHCRNVKNKLLLNLNFMIYCTNINKKPTLLSKIDFWFWVHMLFPAPEKPLKYLENLESKIPCVHLNILCVHVMFYEKLTVFLYHVRKINKCLMKRFLWAPNFVFLQTTQKISIFL